MTRNLYIITIFSGFFPPLTWVRRYKWRAPNVTNSDNCLFAFKPFLTYVLLRPKNRIM